MQVSAKYLVGIGGGAAERELTLGDLLKAPHISTMANTETHPDYPAPYAPNPKLSGDLRIQVIDAIKASGQSAAVAMRDIISTGVQVHLTERRRDYIKATGLTNAEAVTALIDLAIRSIKPQELRGGSKGIGMVSEQVSKVSAEVSPEIVPIPFTKPATAVHETSEIPAAPALPANRWAIRLRGKWQVIGAVACLAVIVTGEVVGLQNLVNRILPPPTTTALIQVDHP